MELSEAWSAGVRAAGGFIFKNILWIAFSNVIRFVPLAFPAARSAIIHSLHFNSAHEFLSVAALTSHIYKMSSVNNGARWIFTSFSLVIMALMLGNRFEIYTRKVKFLSTKYLFDFDLRLFPQHRYTYCYNKWNQAALINSGNKSI